MYFKAINTSKEIKGVNMIKKLKNQNVNIDSKHFTAENFLLLKYVELDITEFKNCCDVKILKGESYFKNRNSKCIIQKSLSIMHKY